MPNIKAIFLENKAWVLEKLQGDRSYFKSGTKDQTPKHLWIGCSDSRILPNEITGTSVGEMFVHRNIANLIHANDLNLMSVVTYALRYLKVRDVIVCGHYGCGGVVSAMGDQSFGLIDEWLKNIKQVVAAHQEELDSIKSPADRSDRLVELNVIAQVNHLKDSSIFKELLAENPQIRLHGWVYDMRSGYIKQLTRNEW
jgi:carbonic anhydrase